MSIYLTGCAGSYRGVSMDEFNQGELNGESSEPALKVGDQLRLTLRDGTVIKGVYLEFDAPLIYLDEARVEGGKVDDFHELPQPEAVPMITPFDVAVIDQVERYDAKVGKSLALTALTLGSVYYFIQESKQHFEEDWLNFED